MYLEHIIAEVYVQCENVLYMHAMYVFASSAFSSCTFVLANKVFCNIRCREANQQA